MPLLLLPYVVVCLMLLLPHAGGRYSLTSINVQHGDTALALHHMAAVNKTLLRAREVRVDKGW